MPAPARAARGWLLTALKLAVTAGLLWLVAGKLDVGVVAARLAAADPRYLALALVLLIIQSLLVVSWRWAQVLASVGPRMRLGRLVLLSWVGQFFNQALPSTVGGDGMRMWLLHRDGCPGAVAVRSVLLERLIGLYALMLLALAGMPRLLALTHGDLRGLSALALTGGGVLAMTGVALAMRRESWREALARRSRLAGAIAALALEAGMVLGRPGLFALLVGVSVAGQVAVCTTVWALAQAFGVPVPLVDANLVLPTLFVLLVVPISIGGWGVREGGMVVMLGLLGIAPGDAVLVSVAFGLLVLLLGLPGGLVWLLLGAPRRPAVEG